jgi:hypothetical protein
VELKGVETVNIEAKDGRKITGECNYEKTKGSHYRMY